jgi:hypothetical protein
VWPYGHANEFFAAKSNVATGLNDALFVDHMNPRLFKRDDPNTKTASPIYAYQKITKHCANQIAYSLEDARKHMGQEAQDRLERAYGVYMGWRALALRSCDPGEFARDALRFEDMINTARSRSACL